MDFTQDRVVQNIVWKRGIWLAQNCKNLSREDAIQQMWLETTEAYSRYQEGRGTFSSFLYGHLKFRAFNYIRDSITCQSAETQWANLKQQFVFPTQTEVDNLLLRINSSLRSRDREIFRLLIDPDLSFIASLDLVGGKVFNRHIARYMGLTDNDVSRSISRIRKVVGRIIHGRQQRHYADAHPSRTRVRATKKTERARRGTNASSNPSTKNHDNRFSENRDRKVDGSTESEHKVADRGHGVLRIRMVSPPRRRMSGEELRSEVHVPISVQESAYRRRNTEERGRGAEERGGRRSRTKRVQRAGRETQKGKIQRNWYVRAKTVRIKKSTIGQACNDAMGISWQPTGDTRSELDISGSKQNRETTKQVSPRVHAPIRNRDADQQKNKLSSLFPQWPPSVEDLGKVLNGLLDRPVIRPRHGIDAPYPSKSGNGPSSSTGETTSIFPLQNKNNQEESDQKPDRSSESLGIHPKVRRVKMKIKGFNDKEQRIYDIVKDGKPHKIGEIKRVMMKDAEAHCKEVYEKGSWDDSTVDAQAQSYVRNSIRRLVRDGWVKKCAHGTYRLTIIGKRWVEQGKDTTKSYGTKRGRKTGTKVKSKSKVASKKISKKKTSKKKTKAAKSATKKAKTKKAKTKKANGKSTKLIAKKAAQKAKKKSSILKKAQAAKRRMGKLVALEKAKAAKSSEAATTA